MRREYRELALDLGLMSLVLATEPAMIGATNELRRVVRPRH